MRQIEKDGQGYAGVREYVHTPAASIRTAFSLKIRPVAELTDNLRGDGKGKALCAAFAKSAKASRPDSVCHAVRGATRLVNLSAGKAGH
ncbi:hypothetical protein D3C87_1462690 [compost metagenome]